MTPSFFGVFVAGLLTFLSPCILPLAPILVAGLVTAGSSSRWARLWTTAWFSVGFAAVFVLVGLSLPAILAVLGPLRPVFLAAAAAVLILFGFKMLHLMPGTARFSWMDRSFQVVAAPGRLPQGLRGLLFGALFGFSWTPCVGPILGGVLTFVAAQHGPTLQSATMLLVFASGVALPLLAVAAGSEYAEPAVRFLRVHTPVFEAIAGLGLVVFAVALLAQLRGEVSGVRLGSAAVTVVSDAGPEVSLGEATPATTRLVFFHSQHCPVCRAMAVYLPRFLADCASSHLAFVGVDVDRPENAAAVERFHVRAVPTTSVFSPLGKEIFHLVGYQSEGRLRRVAQDASPVVCARRDVPALEAPPTPAKAACGLHDVC